MKGIPTSISLNLAEWCSPLRCLLPWRERWSQRIWKVSLGTAATNDAQIPTTQGQDPKRELRRLSLEFSTYHHLTEEVSLQTASFSKSGEGQIRGCQLRRNSVPGEVGSVKDHHELSKACWQVLKQNPRSKKRFSRCYCFLGVLKMLTRQCSTTPWHVSRMTTSTLRIASKN